MADEHPFFEHICFPMVRYDASVSVNESRWIRGSSNGAVFVTTDPNGDPIDVNITNTTLPPINIVPTDQPANGFDMYLFNSVNAKTLLKSGTGTIYWVDGCNPDNAANAWVLLFDAASTVAVTLGTTPPIFQMALPLGAGSSTTSGIRDVTLPFPVGFTNGLVAAVVTAINGSTPVASPVPIQVLGMAA